MAIYVREAGLDSQGAPGSLRNARLIRNVSRVSHDNANHPLRP